MQKDNLLLGEPPAEFFPEGARWLFDVDADVGVGSEKHYRRMKHDGYFVLEPFDAIHAIEIYGVEWRARVDCRDGDYIIVDGYATGGEGFVEQWCGV